MAQKARWRRAVPLVTLLLGCGSAEVRSAQDVLPQADDLHVTQDVYRPAWTAGIQVHAAEIRVCVQGRQPPVLVVHVEALVSGATGVTAVDGFGAVEHCKADGGRVLRRWPANHGPEIFVGSPAFVLGAARPSVGAAVPLEEIVDEQASLGWLYWPSFTSETGR